MNLTPEQEAIVDDAVGKIAISAAIRLAVATAIARAVEQLQERSEDTARLDYWLGFSAEFSSRGEIDDARKL